MVSFPDAAGLLRHDGNTTSNGIGAYQSAALHFISSHVVKGTDLIADEAISWNALQSRFAMQRIAHELVYSNGTGV